MKFQDAIDPSLVDTSFTGWGQATKLANKFILVLSSVTVLKGPLGGLLVIDLISLKLAINSPTYTYC